jgi:hypothetical protein
VLDLELSRQHAGREQDPLDLVPEELPRAADRAGGDEHRRRRLEALADRLGEVQVVGVAVVEGDAHRAPRQAALAVQPGHLGHRQHFAVAHQDLDLRGEVGRRDHQRPRVDRHVGDPVVHQHHRPGQHPLDEAARQRGELDARQPPDQPVHAAEALGDPHPSQALAGAGARLDWPSA